MNPWTELAFPIIFPLGFGILCLLFRQYIKIYKIFTVLSMTSSLIASIYLFYQVYVNHAIPVLNLGNWSPPFGIIFVADLLTATMLVFSSLAGLFVSIYSIFYIRPERAKHYYYAFFNFLMVGVHGSFLTGDIFNLYVFFEVMLMSSYALLTLGNERSQLMESIKYTTLNLVASAFFVVGVGVLYGMMGTLNMADIADKVTRIAFLNETNKGVFLIVAIIFLTVFGVKGGIFPLYYWLPGSYVVPPTAVSAIFGGLLTKVGVYCMLRIFSLIFYRVESVTGTNYISTVIVILGAFTMLFGVFGAIIQYNFKKILSHHIISQVGYMFFGIGLGTVGAIAGAIMHIVHNIVVKTTLFLVSGIHERLTGTNDLKKTGGLVYAVPFVATFFLVAALALAGIPPLSGFFSKFVIIKAGVNQIIQTRSPILYVAVIVSLITSLLTLLSMIKIWIFGFWGKAKTPVQTENVNYRALLAPVIGFTLIAVAMGIFAEFFYDVALTAAHQLKNPENYYIPAVLKHQIPR